MSDAMTLGASAAPAALEHGGVRFEFGALTRRRMDEFSSRLIARDRERLAAVYGHDQAALALRLAELERAALAGEYDFLEPRVIGTPRAVEETREVDGAAVRGVRQDSEGGELRTPRGRVLLASVLTGRPEEEVMRLFAERPAEAAHALSMSLSRSLGSGGAAWRPLPPGGEAPQGNP